MGKTLCLLTWEKQPGSASCDLSNRQRAVSEGEERRTVTVDIMHDFLLADFQGVCHLAPNPGSEAGASTLLPHRKPV